MASVVKAELFRCRYALCAFVVGQAVLLGVGVPHLGYPASNVLFYLYFALFAVCGWAIGRAWAFVLLIIPGAAVWLSELLHGRAVNPLLAVIAGVAISLPGVSVIAAGLLARRAWDRRRQRPDQHFAP